MKARGGESIFLAALLVLGICGCLAAPAPSFPAPRYHEVSQDHYDGHNSNTWMQAYYVNEAHFTRGSDAPVFLCMGGEGPPIDGSAVVASVHCNDAVELAPATGALVLALEHRYYGCHNMSACPVSSFKDGTASLRFLSSRQALGDMAAFVAHVKDAFALTERNRIVTFGGSYPGMLASFARLKFPNLIFASVSSSAPVEAVLDMTGYNNVVASAYAVSDNGVGGSALCRSAIAKGHEDIGTMMKNSAGRDQLAKLFELPSGAYLEPIANRRNFAGEGVAQFPSQSNDLTCTSPACNIKKICAIMVDETLGDEVARLAKVASAQRSSSVDHLNRRGTGTSLAPGTRGDSLPDFWGYQTCTEFAFYQTCEVGTDCFFTQGLMLLEDMEGFCGSQFNISLNQVTENVGYSNLYYGGRDPAGSRVLYVNGEVDPWHSQSILKSPSSEFPTLWVAGAAHHTWTHPSEPTDQASVIAAREAIWAQVKAWLNVNEDA